MNYVDYLNQPKSAGLVIRKNIKHPNLKLYRYMNLSQFLNWLETGNTYLTRIITWPDTQEIPIREIAVSDPDNPFNIADINDLFGQCWSRVADSDAMWRIYSNNGEGLMIRTSIKRFQLIGNLKHALLSPVDYGHLVFDSSWEYYDEWLVGCHAVCEYALHKRTAFRHEREIRLVAKNPESFDEPASDNQNVIPLPLDPKEFIEGVTIDPRASDWYVKAIQKYCERYELPIIPVKSSLYKPIEPYCKPSS